MEETTPQAKLLADIERLVYHQPRIETIKAYLDALRRIHKPPDKADS